MKRRLPPWLPLVLLAASLVAIVAIAIDEATSPDTVRYRVPSESMKPAFEVGTIIEVNRDAYDEEDPKRGDVVVIYPPAGADLNTCGVDHPEHQPCPRPTRRRSDTKFIKRIVGLPGERISFRRGRTVVDGEPQPEDFAQVPATCPVCDMRREATIPPDHYFMVGDNRGESADSRAWGPIPRDWIIGRVED